jgi:hypothetical protein
MCKIPRAFDHKPPKRWRETEGTRFQPAAVSEVYARLGTPGDNLASHAHPRCVWVHRRRINKEI